MKLFLPGFLMNFFFLFYIGSIWWFRPTFLLNHSLASATAPFGIFFIFPLLFCSVSPFTASGWHIALPLDSDFSPLSFYTSRHLVQFQYVSCQSKHEGSFIQTQDSYSLYADDSPFYIFSPDFLSIPRSLNTICTEYFHLYADVHVHIKFDMLTTEFKYI